MNPNNLQFSDQESQPTTPTPIVGDRSAQIPASPGTERPSPIKLWLPRLIIGAVIINIFPTLGLLAFGEANYPLILEVRNYANFIFIIGFIIIIISQIRSSK